MGLADRHYQRDEFNRPFTPGPWQSIYFTATMWLIAIHLLGYLFCIFSTPTVLSGMGAHLIFSRDLAISQLQLWRFLTYFLAQDNLLAVFINLFTLFFTARMLEMAWGWRKLVMAYLAFALAGSLAAGLFAWFLPTGNHPELYGPTAPITGLLVAAVFYFERKKSAIPHTHSPLPLRTFLAFMIIFQAALPILGISSWLSLVASAGAGLAAGLWVTQSTRARSTNPSKPSHAAPDAPAYAVRPSDKTQWELAKADELEDLDKEVDRILDKVRKQTLASLTQEEKQTLKRATDLKNQTPARR
jgi:membrane associated rhomboid family serine protease